MCLENTFPDIGNLQWKILNFRGFKKTLKFLKKSSKFLYRNAMIIKLFFTDDYVIHSVYTQYIVCINYV